jgi:hypothetical protein
VPAAALVAALSLGLVASAAAATGNKHGAAANRNVRAVCGAVPVGRDRCFALRRTDIAGRKGASVLITPAGYGPADLANAYKLPPNGGAGQTVAIVDAYDDPNAESDLATYRSQFGLPACTTANGCFRKVDQAGGSNYPPSDNGWAGEISLDVDMVSAVAPQAHILLVEATDNSDANLGQAVDEAVALGAKYVSNSYGSSYDSTPGSGEFQGEVTDLDPYYNHPGVAVVASSGDSGYGVSYPAASQYVTSVGGTSLLRAAGARGWSESVWNDAEGAPGSGCSRYEAEPTWQIHVGCSMRAVADVSAVADPETGVAVYDTFGDSGWDVFGGTSASSPIIAGVFADAGTPVAGTYPSSYPYHAAGGLYDVTTGRNGSPCSPAYLCAAGLGWDGPTGLGTPNGLAAFTAPHGTISGTVTDAVTNDPIAGAQVTAGSAQAVADASGHYSMSVPVGTYSVTASASGYQSETFSGESVANGQTVSLDFALSAPDVTPPTDAPVVSGTSGNGDWYTSDVSVAWHWTDEVGGSGIDPAHCTQTSDSGGAEGAAVLASSSCQDMAGNVASDSLTFEIDKTAPTILCAVAAPGPTFALGAAGQQLSAAASDATSGVAGSASLTAAADTSSVGAKTATFSATDNAGNTANASCPYVVGYRFGGFVSPLPKTMIKSGSALPVKFQLQNAAGQPISDSEAQSLVSPSCTIAIILVKGGPVTGCPTYSSSTHQFQLNVKTTKAMKGANGVSVTVTIGGAIVTASPVSPFTVM